MKKLITLGLVLVSLGAHGNTEHDKIWNSIGILGRTLNALSGEVNKLMTKVNQIPPPINYVAGQGIEIHGTVIQATLTNQHHIGDEYRGGIVFFVDESGQHGLIASKRDINQQGIQWRNGSSGNKVTNARGDGIGAGETNTRLIIARQTGDKQNGNFAALAAQNFQVLADGVTPCKTPIAPDSICYGGWYLPSAYELQLLHNNLHQSNLSTFAPEYYWSSTEASVANAWLQNFATGEITASSKSNTMGRVRAISHF